VQRLWPAKMGGTYSRPSVPSKWHDEYVKKMPSMIGKVVVITGTTTGLGNVAARDLASKGARVILLNRPSDRARKAEEDVRTAAAGGGSVESVGCDLQDFASVRAAADKVLHIVQDSGVDVLCNNAGAML
jgi:NAD(P)-dependent dehydrogenase (short-subunit alcohol dehydrogenase family)